MIICKGIVKRYNNQNAIDNFSYSFNNSGFYLLFGISGSGKTTLLNVLAGHLSFDEGIVEYDNKQYIGQVNLKDIDYYIEYITQDANFIDYLSVYDNLALCNKNKEIIEGYLERFGLIDKKNVLPNKLSGGEKQRVCLVRALLRGKRVLLLDEPTAALDIENKILVFEVLRNIKKDILIICSSHDEVAKNYADECIDFNKKAEYSSEYIDKTGQNKKNTKCNNISEKEIKGKMSSPILYIKKWFTSPLKNKVSKIWFTILMTLAFMVLCLGDTPGNKFKSSVEYIYGFNQLEVWATRGNEGYIKSLYDREDIKEIVINYSGSVPYETEETELPDELKEMLGDTSGESAYVSADYELDLWTLPINRDNFYIEDFLLCGRYIENENEIILAHNAIPKDKNPESYIGTTRNIKLYDGEYIMTVVGVMKEPALAERQYLNASGVTVSDGTSGSYSATYAISAAITNKYINDEKFYSGMDERCYYLYFDSYEDMKNFYDETENGHGLVFVSPQIENSLTDIFEMMNKYMYPIGIIASIMAVIFYFQVQRTELLYNRKIFMVYQYLGYSVGKIKAIWLLFSVLDLIKTFAMSLVISLLLTYGINVINRTEKFISFEIFTYNAGVIIKVFMAVIVTGVISALFMLRKIKVKNMSVNLAKQRDLL